MSFLEDAIETAYKFFGEKEAAIYGRRLRAFSNLPGSERKLRELASAAKMEFPDLMKEVDYALAFTGLGFKVEVEPDAGSKGAKCIDLRIERDGQECFVEITCFRPMYEGPPEFQGGMDISLQEYGDTDRDMGKVAQKILAKTGQLGSRTSIIALWNDDGDLEELEVEEAVRYLSKEGSLPEGLQFVLYGSPWIGKQQLYCYPAKPHLAPVFHVWMKELEGCSFQQLISAACKALEPKRA